MTEIEWWEYDDAGELANAVALTERDGVTWQDD